MNNRKVVTDFIKAFSCSYSITKNLGLALGQEEDPCLLQAVIGFSSGVSAMGDTCGAANGGCVVLGKHFPDLPDNQFYALCSEFFQRLEKRRGTPNCGRIHGGKHLASNLRRAILTGKPLKCAGVLRHTSQLLKELEQEVTSGEFSGHQFQLSDMIKHFQDQCFHCCHTTLKTLADADPPATSVEHLLQPSRGFCGGIGFNGTLCGAIAGGVLWLGLKEGVDLRDCDYLDSLQMVWQGLIKSEAVFQDEKNFPPARLFNKCQSVYQAVENRFGGAHCRDILDLSLNRDADAKRYIEENKINLCRKVVQTVVATVRDPN